MKRSFLILVALSVAACSTDFYTYQGGAPMIGQGGAAKNVNGIEIWLTGAPPRKFQIIGYIEDTRPGGPLAMAQRYPALAASAKQHGGDGILIQSDTAQVVGAMTTGNAFTSVNASVYGNGFNGSAVTTGSSFSAPIIRREGRFFVIKYL